MGAANFQNLLLSLFKWTVLWINCLRQPFLTIERELSGSPNDNQCLIYTLQLWSISFFIDLGINNFPVYLYLNINWQSAAFLLSSILIKLIIFLIAGIAIHFGLKRKKVPTNFAQTSYIYAVFITCHSPIFSFIQYYFRLETFSQLQTAKFQGNSFIDNIIEIITRIDEYPVENTVSSIIIFASDTLIKPLNFFYMGILIVLLQRILSAHYGSEKYKTFSGIALGLGVSSVLTLPLALLYLFLLYTVL